MEKLQQKTDMSDLLYWIARLPLVPIHSLHANLVERRLIESDFRWLSGRPEKHQIKVFKEHQSNPIDDQPLTRH